MTVPEAPVGGPAVGEQAVSEQAVGEQAAEEQAREEARLRLRRGRLTTAVLAATLAVLVGVVALLGGFDRRTDLLTPVAIGSVVSTGPYEVTIASATVKHRTSSDEWVVVASGTARTTGLTSIDPPTGSSGFVFARNAGGGQTQASYSIKLGDPASFSSRDTLTPGLGPVPWSVTFQFPTSPGDTLLLAVFEQEYTTPYLFSDEEGWRPTRAASTMTLPLEKLADSEY